VYLAPRRPLDGADSLFGWLVLDFLPRLPPYALFRCLVARLPRRSIDFESLRLAIWQELLPQVSIKTQPKAWLFKYGFPLHFLLSLAPMVQHRAS